MPSRKFESHPENAHVEHQRRSHQTWLVSMKTRRETTFKATPTSRSKQKQGSKLTSRSEPWRRIVAEDSGTLVQIVKSSEVTSRKLPRSSRSVGLTTGR